MVLWMTDEPCEDAASIWWALRDIPDLQVVLLDDLDPQPSPVGARRPWDQAELGLELMEVPELSTLGEALASPWRSWKSSETRDDPELEARLRASTVLTREQSESMIQRRRARWDGPDFSPEDLEHRAPFTGFPGLARRQDGSLPLAVLEETVKGQSPAFVGLVPSARAADIPMEIGLLSTIDLWGVTADGVHETALLTARLRSWEERFGARVLRLGWATIYLLIARPPTSDEHALAVAGELYGVAAEFGEGAVTSVSEIAAQVIGSPLWRLWWD